MLEILSRHEFESIARGHYRGIKFRAFDRWRQLVAMSGQLLLRASLHDLMTLL